MMKLQGTEREPDVPLVARGKIIGIQLEQFLLLTVDLAHMVAEFCAELIRLLLLDLLNHSLMLADGAGDGLIILHAERSEPVVMSIIADDHAPAQRLSGSGKEDFVKTVVVIDEERIIMCIVRASALRCSLSALQPYRAYIGSGRAGSPPPPAIRAETAHAPHDPD